MTGFYMERKTGLKWVNLMTGAFFVFKVNKDSIMLLVFFLLTRKKIQVNILSVYIHNFEQKQTLWPLFMDGFQMPQGDRATTMRQFTFYHLVPRNFWCAFDRPRKDERLS